MTKTHKLARGLALGTLLAASAAAFAQDRFAVSARSVDEVGVTKTHRAPAEVVSLNQSAVAAETEGIVSSVHANAGDLVEAGALLIALDTTDLELAEKRIRADLRNRSVLRSVEPSIHGKVETALYRNRIGNRAR